MLPGSQRRLKYISADSYEAFISPTGYDRVPAKHGAANWFAIMNLDTLDGYGTHWVAMLVDRKHIRRDSEEPIAVYIDPLNGEYYKLPYPISQFLAQHRVSKINADPSAIQHKLIANEYGRKYIDSFCGTYAIGLMMPYLIQRGVIRSSVRSELGTIFGITAEPDSAKKILSADAIVDDFRRYITRKA